MDTQVSNAKLFGKIASVMAQVRQLEKSGKNTYDKYEFMTADTVAHRIGTALAGAGVAFFPSIVSVDTSEYTTAKGAANFRSVVTMQLTFACTETGATYTILWSGEAIDRSDKSISKAAVSAVKFALIKTFLLTGGDEEDADAVSPEVEAGRPLGKAVPREPSGRGGYKDDELWEREPSGHEKSKKADGLSQAQLTRLTLLVTDFYGPEAAEQQVKLSQAVSKGSVSQFKDLTAKEAQVLIGGIERKMKEVQQATNGVAA